MNINNIQNYNKDHLQTKENFCAPCLMALPLALGTGGAVQSSKSNNKKTKKIIFWSSISLIIISIIIYIILKKKCTSCA